LGIAVWSALAGSAGHFWSVRADDAHFHRHLPSLRVAAVFLKALHPPPRSENLTITG